MRSIHLPFLSLDLIPYAGRYIAVIEGSIVAVAGSAEDARDLARLARPQRSPTILYIAPQPNPNPDHPSPTT